MRFIRGRKGCMIYPFFYTLLFSAEIKNFIYSPAIHPKQNLLYETRFSLANDAKSKPFPFFLSLSPEKYRLYVYIFFFSQASNETHIEHLPLGSRTC